MARRGDQLREHILWVAKDVFLELGFERSSMDVVAARSETTKRSLYAHFENKQKLFLSVIDLVRELLLARLKSPSDYSEEPCEALTLFCARYLEILTYEGSMRMIRISVAERDRFSEQAAQYFDALFVQVHARLSAYLKAAFATSSETCDEAADRVLGQILYPRLPRALFGIDDLAPSFDREALAPDFDLAPIRKIVVQMMESVRQSASNAASRP